MLQNLVVYSFLYKFVADYTNSFMKTIKNPTRYHKDGVTKAQLQVVDYDSLIARNKRAQDLALRLQEEIRLYNSTGGRVVFVTFTYDDNNLPRFFYQDEESGEMHNFPCFSKDDKDRYLDSLRHYLYRNFEDFYSNMTDEYTLDGEKLPFRYCWASEFGTKNTHRSHYHCLFFLPVTIVRQIIDEYGEDNLDFQLKVLLGHLWDKGFVLWTDEKKQDRYPICVDSDCAPRYVAKYCMKQLRFYDQPELKEYLYEKDGSINERKKEAVKRFLPFHKTSNHVGESLKEYYKTPEDFSNGISYRLKSDLDHGIDKKYKAPRYIERKTLYEFCKDGCRFVVSDFGREIKLKQFVIDFENKVSNLKFSLSLQELYRKVDDTDVEKYFSKKYGLKTVYELYQFITSILIENNRIEEFVLYSKVWRGREVGRVNFFELNDIFNELSYQELFDNSLSMYELSLIPDEYDDFIDIGYFKVHHAQPLYNNLARFRDFDKVAWCLEVVNEVYSTKIVRNYIQNCEREKLTKFSVLTA